MAGFHDLTELLNEDADHRIVVVREDGTPVGVLLPLNTYRTLIGKAAQVDDVVAEEEGVRGAMAAALAEHDTGTPHKEWDSLIEQVSTEGKPEEDTYLFEPVE